MKSNYEIIEEYLVLSVPKEMTEIVRVEYKDKTDGNYKIATTEVDQILGMTLKDYVSQKFSSLLGEMEKEVKKLRKLVHERDWDQANLDEGFNQALDVVKGIINKYK